jgi:hypothetical protein
MFTQTTTMRLLFVRMFLLCSIGVFATTISLETATAQKTSVLVPSPTLRSGIELRDPATTSSRSFGGGTVVDDQSQPTCIFTKPDKNGYVPPGACEGMSRNYYPSYRAAVFVSVLFGAVMLAHLAQAIYHRKVFCWVIIMAAILLLGSYVLRSAGTRDQQNPYIVTISDILLLMSPIGRSSFPMPII